jgi:hypothetical protein
VQDAGWIQDSGFRIQDFGSAEAAMGILMPMPKTWNAASSVFPPDKKTPENLHIKCCSDSGATAY